MGAALSIYEKHWKNISLLESQMDMTGAVSGFSGERIAFRNRNYIEFLIRIEGVYLRLKGALKQNRLRGGWQEIHGHFSMCLSKGIDLESEPKAYNRTRQA